MFCIQCGQEISDGSKFCNVCGTSVEKKDSEISTVCPKCHTGDQSGNNFCTNCRYPLTPAAVEASEKRNLATMQAAQIALQAEQLKTQQKMMNMQAASMAAQARCPKCGSTSLSGQKKGYGIGKGVVGVAVVGAVFLPAALIGLTAGNLGAKKVRVTCMRCGHKFWAGKG